MGGKKHSVLYLSRKGRRKTRAQRVYYELEGTQRGSVGFGGRGRDLNQRRLLFYRRDHGQLVRSRGEGGSWEENFSGQGGTPRCEFPVLRGTRKARASGRRTVTTRTTERNRNTAGEISEVVAQNQWENCLRRYGLGDRTLKKNQD